LKFQEICVQENIVGSELAPREMMSPDFRIDDGKQDAAGEYSQSAGRMDIGFRFRRRSMIKDRSGILALGLDK
jgi:hypothetical protein